MPNTNFDSQPLLPGIDNDGGVAVEETKPEQESVPEVSVKFAVPGDGLDDECPNCNGGCVMCASKKKRSN